MIREVLQVAAFVTASYLLGVLWGPVIMAALVG